MTSLIIQTQPKEYVDFLKTKIPSGADPTAYMNPQTIFDWLVLTPLEMTGTAFDKYLKEEIFLEDSGDATVNTNAIDLRNLAMMVANRGSFKGKTFIAEDKWAQWAEVNWMSPEVREKVRNKTLVVKSLSEYDELKKEFKNTVDINAIGMQKQYMSAALNFPPPEPWMVAPENKPSSW